MSPEFMLRPSLSAGRVAAARGRDARVAGVYAPAFVERGGTMPAGTVLVAGVAGVYAPAFVERSPWRRPPSAADGVSPEFMHRPSLSEVQRHDADDQNGEVSPEFMLRPSLSAPSWCRARAALIRGVAGVYAPAFVERERGNVSERENPYVWPAGLL